MTNLLLTYGADINALDNVKIFKNKYIILKF